MKQLVLCVMLLVMFGCGSGSESGSAQTYYEGSWGYNDPATKIRLNLTITPDLQAYTGTVHFEKYSLKSEGDSGSLITSYHTAVLPPDAVLVVEGVSPLEIRSGLYAEIPGAGGYPQVVGSIRPTDEFPSSHNTLVYSHHADGVTSHYPLTRM